jgi:hypothetical protein
MVLLAHSDGFETLDDTGFVRQRELLVGVATHSGSVARYCSYPGDGIED